MNKLPLLVELASGVHGMASLFAGLLEDEALWHENLLKMIMQAKKSKKVAALATQTGSQPLSLAASFLRSGHRLSEGDVVPISGRQEKRKAKVMLKRTHTNEQLKQFILDAMKEDWHNWYEKNVALVREVFCGDQKGLAIFMKQLAATSQAANPVGNVSLAIGAFKTYVRSGDRGRYRGVARANLRRIARGQDPQGPKISAYAGALSGDMSRVAVDRHIFDIFFGSMGGSDIKREIIVEIIGQLAQEVGLKPAEVQACLWAANQLRKGTTPGNYIPVLEKRIVELRDLASQFRQLRVNEGVKIRESKLLTEKYIWGDSSLCLHCNKFLRPLDIVENPYSSYSPGQLWRCLCGKSRIYTNAVRNIRSLLTYFETGKDMYGHDEYVHGFCNDKHCGFLLKPPVDIIRNGVPVAGHARSSDLMGNEYHETNNKIAHWFGKELPESDSSTQEITEWYRKNIDKLKKFL